LVLFFVLVLFAMLPARADVRIVSSTGGAVDAYLGRLLAKQTSARTISSEPPLQPITLAYEPVTT
jgi:hypothetical protein